MRVAVVLLPVLVGGVAVLYSVSSVNSQNVQKRPTQEARWVPFSSDMERTDERGAVQAGRFFRARDGSTRHESGHSKDQTDMVAIKNIAKRTFFQWRRATGWTSQPMDVPPWGWRPPNARPDLGSESGVVGQVEGFEVIRVDLAGGGYLLQAPALDYVTLQHSCDQGPPCGFRHFNIRAGDQPPELFDPEPDAIVTPLEGPAGIVRRR